MTAIRGHDHDKQAPSSDDCDIGETISVFKTLNCHSDHDDRVSDDAGNRDGGNSDSDSNSHIDETICVSKEKLLSLGAINGKGQRQKLTAP